MMINTADDQYNAVVFMVVYYTCTTLVGGNG